MDYRAAVLGLLPVKASTSNAENSRGPAVAESVHEHKAPRSHVCTVLRRHEQHPSLHNDRPCSRPSLPQFRETHLAYQDGSDNAEVRPPARMNYKAALLGTLPKPTAEELRSQREKENRKSGFMRLPPELRNRIYQDVLLSGPLVRTHKYWRILEPTELTLLHLCRQIRNDTLSVFFGNISFRFDLTHSANYFRCRDFLMNLPMGATASIRRLYFQAETVCNCKNSTGKSSCVFLKVFIDCDEKERWGARHSWVGEKRCETKKQRGVALERRPPKKVFALVERIGQSATKQAVSRKDLEELLDALKPISSFELWRL